MPETQLFETVPLLKMVKVDFPEASELLVEFPEKWVAVARLTHENEPLYVAAWTEEESKTEFHGLRLGLTHYSLVRFFQPSPMPSVYVAWDTQKDVGEVIGHEGLQVRLHSIGQAQAWHSKEVAVLWECYLNKTGRKRDWQKLLHRLWLLVERYLNVKKFYTLPREPIFKSDEDYQRFLTKLGYQPDVEAQGWWSKEV